MTRPRLATLVAVAIGIGVIGAIAFVVFEAAVDHGSDEVWNTLARTDETRWLVVPLAIVLSIAFSLVVRLVSQPRYTEPKTDLLAEGGTPEPASVTSIAVIFFVGVSSLVAGASLGRKRRSWRYLLPSVHGSQREAAPATTHKRSCSPASARCSSRSSAHSSRC